MKYAAIKAFITGTNFAAKRSNTVTLNGQQLWVASELAFQQYEAFKKNMPSFDDQEAWQEWSDQKTMLFQIYCSLSKAASDAK